MTTNPATQPTPPSQPCPANDTKEALCILHNVQSPLKVEIFGPEIPPRDGRLKRQRVKLLSDDVRTVKENCCNFNTVSFSNEILVPVECLIRPVSFRQDSIEKQRTVIGELYRPVTINAESTDIFAWAPPLTGLKRTELIQCSIYFAGSEIPNGEKVYALVCPLNFISETTLAYSSPLKKEKVKGFGTVFKAPIRDVYRWEDINQRRKLVAETLKFGNISPDSNGSCQEFVYTMPDKIPQNGSETKQVYPPLPSGELQDETEARKNSTGTSGPLTKTRCNALSTRRIPQDETKELHNSCDNKNDDESSQDTNGVKERERDTTALPSGNVPQDKQQSEDSFKNENGEDSSQNTNNPSESSGGVVKSSDNKDDRNDITGGIVAGTRGKFLQGASKSQKNEKSYSDALKRQKSQNGEPKRTSAKQKNTALFAKCFAKDVHIKEIEIDEIRIGDIVVACSQENDNIMGSVKLICQLPTLKEKYFVEVEFEENINVAPYEVRHEFGTDDCIDKNCLKTPKNVFIPLAFLLNTESSEKPLRVIKATTNGRKTGKSIAASPVPKHASEVEVDFVYQANRRDFIETPIKYEKVANKPENFGIEGNHNSCYIDAVLFSMFTFTNKFDYGFKRPTTKPRENEKLWMKIEAARNLLKYDIVTQLRTGSKVSWDRVYMLRKALAEILNDDSYLGNFMDAETFIVSLFSTVLGVPEFYEIGEDNKDYVLQLFPPMSPEGETKDAKYSVQHILEEYCKWTGIKLAKVPDTGFLIKLPVSNGVPQFKKVYPNLTLDLRNLIENEEGKKEMVLKSIICLKKSHFTCFVRIFPDISDQEKQANWVYHDSLASDSPILKECEGLELALELVAPEFHNHDPPKSVDKSSLKKDVRKCLDTLLKNAYICIYEEAHLSTNL